LKVRRDILLFAALAIAAVVGGWWLLAKRPGAAIEAFIRDEALRTQAAQPRLPAADAFRATVCPGEACVAIEAGGLTFILGAGAGAAEGVRALGLMHPTLDGVLLPDANLSTVEGLAALAQASGGAGRREPLKVFAPSGSLTVVDGANLLASGGAAPRLALSPEGVDQGLEGRLIFDSGVVAIRAFGAADRIYRVDFDGKSLILAGCTAQAHDILAATRGTRVTAGVLAAGSTQLRPDTPPRCTEVNELLEVGREARLAAMLIIPADPKGAQAAWYDLLMQTNTPAAMIGAGHARIDLSGPTPRISGVQ
jgi:hypothetical protein